METLPLSSVKLQELARQARHFNEFPLQLPGVFYSGDPLPLAETLRPLVAEAASYIELLTDDEYDRLISAIPPGFRMFIDDPSRDIPEACERVALYYLSAAVARIYVSFKDIIQSSPSESIVVKTYPELERLFDEDNLLRVDDRFELHDGGIQYKQHILHYHQFLRRGFTSNPNFDFLARFMRCREETSAINSFRIAIDHHRIMPVEFFQHLVECDAWFGPAFSTATLDDAEAVGVTMIKRNADPAFGSNYDLDRAEFMWTYRDGIKTFQAEEIASLRAHFDQFYLNRYLHSERDTTARRFQHVDGAVKVYLDSDYHRRFDSMMPQHAKSYRKIKLWRIDGDIGITHWLKLVSYFFKGNEMVLEYLDPQQFRALVAERERRRLERSPSVES